MSKPALLWILPVLAFADAAMLTAVLRQGGDDPRPVRATTDVARVIAAPRLSDVPGLPKPLATPTPRPRQARMARAAPVRAAPAQPAPATAAPTQPAPATTPSVPVPQPAPTSAPAVPVQEAAPAPTFEDAGAGPTFDDSGPAP